MRNHATSSEASKNEALTKLRQVIIIMKENISDYDKTVKIRRIFSTPDDFKSKIFRIFLKDFFFIKN